MTEPVRRTDAHVLHSINGTTKFVSFHAPRVTTQTNPEVIYVALYDENDTEIGTAGFTGGMAVLSGAAYDQYKPVSRPVLDEPDTDTEPGPATVGADV